MYNKKQTSNTGTGMGLFGTVFIVFLILKLFNLISWSWVWVLCPIWIPIVVLIVILIVVLLISMLELVLKGRL